MALSNLITVKFTQEELQQIDEATATIRSVLAGKVINLTPEQRSQYGRINEENKLLVNRVKDMEERNPEMHPPFLDRTEFDLDFDARKQLEHRVDDMTKVSEMLIDTKTLLDFDNYNYAISYYRYIKMLSTQDVPGSTSVYQNLREVYESQIAASRRALDASRQTEEEDTPPEV